MAFCVRKLSADATFLFTLWHSNIQAKELHPSEFNVLVDPWLFGDSPFFHPSFAVSRHTCSSAIASLAELERPPDLVIVSQDKDDHCHKATLCSLPKSWPTCILATPSAHRKIRSWRHFDERRMRALNAFNEHSPETVLQLPMKGSNPHFADGELTVANMVPNLTQLVYITP